MLTAQGAEQQEIDRAVERLFTRDDAQRVDSLRELFVGKLDFARADGAISMPKIGGIQFAAARRIARLDGVEVALVAAPDDSALGAAALRELYRASATQLGEVLLVCSTRDGSNWQFIYPKQQNGKEVLRRLSVQQGQPRRTFVEQISKLVDERSSLGIHSALENLYNVDRVTKLFFAEYKRVFDKVMASIVGLPDPEERRLFCQTLFNRLMFLYFLQRKGCLIFNGRIDYLDALWQSYTPSDESSFYQTRLWSLFFLALSNEKSQDFSDARQAMEPQIGRVPFLNGGLFDMEELDSRDGVDVPDDAIKSILTELFARFNFTITEGTPYDVEVAVDPEMLGKAFERLVTGRHESGSYYTPRPIVSFMGKEALKGYLSHSVPSETPGAIERFVDGHSAKELHNPESVLEAIKRVRICDPACGSGAYLLGMLQELLALRTCLFAEHRIGPDDVYKRKLAIIQDNLYGVDIDQFAVNIARLRLWLSLIVDYTGATPPPLPNLDFKIERGDSLTAPAPRGTRQLELGGSLLPDYLEAKNRFADAHSEEKRALRIEIAALQRDIAVWVHRGVTAIDGFDWGVAFAEVFSDGGFDIVLANPPYVRHEAIKERKPALEAEFPEVYSSMADLYCYFYARAVQILKVDGILAYISSNKWLLAKYGLNLRKLLSNTCEVQSVIDFGDLPIFEDATTYPMILIARLSRNRRTSTVYTHVQSLLAPYPDLSAIVQGTGQVLPEGALSDGDWKLADPTSSYRAQRMKATSISLGEYTQGRILYGIKTGCTKAFVIRGPRRRELIEQDARSTEIIRPLAMGKDIGKWRAKPQDRWLIFTPIGTDIQKYPAVLDHLKQWQKTLELRSDQGNHWWELRSCDYYDTFLNPKIIYQIFQVKPAFAFEERELFVNNSAYCIPLNDLYLLGVLNSAPFNLEIQRNCTLIQNGYQLMRDYLMKCLVPKSLSANSNVGEKPLLRST